MNRQCVVLVALALLVAPAALVRAQQPTTKPQRQTYPPGKRIEVLRRFTGGFPADGRDRRIPQKFITDERAWGEFWQILSGNAVRPAVDFEKEIVLVSVIGDENLLSLDSFIDEQGNVTSLHMATCVDYGNPQHGSYLLHVVAREGIKTVNDKPVRKGIWREANKSDFRR